MGDSHEYIQKQICGVSGCLQGRVARGLVLKLLKLRPTKASLIVCYESVHSTYIFSQFVWMSLISELWMVNCEIVKRNVGDELKQTRQMLLYLFRDDMYSMSWKVIKSLTKNKSSSCLFSQENVGLFTWCHKPRLTEIM